jgi:hypothetical protein
LDDKKERVIENTPCGSTKSHHRRKRFPRGR